MLPPAFGKLHPRYGTPLAVIKIIGLTGLLLGIGWAIYALSRRRAADEARGRA